ncbi:hypothetical protein P8452_01724 [Trifolium repens]|nr:hypothetical protein P8452_01724 [Trifolium repens]
MLKKKTLLVLLLHFFFLSHSFSISLVFSHNTTLTAKPQILLKLPPLLLSDYNAQFLEPVLLWLDLLTISSTILLCCAIFVF